MSEPAPRRSIMDTPETEEIQNSDIYLSEQIDRLVSVEVPTLAMRMFQTPTLAELPHIYAIENIASETHALETEGDIYTTIYNLMLASYGEVQFSEVEQLEGSLSLRLGLISFDNNLQAYDHFGYGLPDPCSFVIFDWVLMHIGGVLYADGYINGTIVTWFEENNTDAFSGVLVSPYNKILGTENWTMG